MPICNVCHDPKCRPVAAYGAWCCEAALKGAAQITPTKLILARFLEAMHSEGWSETYVVNRQVECLRKLAKLYEISEQEAEDRLVLAYALEVSP